MSAVPGGGEFEVVRGGPACPDGHLMIQGPKSLRHIPARCDVVQSLEKDVWCVAESHIRQFVNYVDACGFDVTVAGDIAVMLE